MYYILNENIALRSWRLVPYAFYIKHDCLAHGLKKEEFELLSLCDGRHEIEDSALVKSLADRSLIVPVEKGGAELTEWQKPLVCDNRYMPHMNWMITGKCNYNCLHCFNAKDNAPLQSEWPLDEANALLDEAQKCGINAILLTGGEPMAHKHFFEIVEGIYKRGMFVFELNTNGFYINQAALDRFREIGCSPFMKISFDGIGYHDWMRNHKGTEADAIRAIKLSKQNGFRVMVQMNFNRKNRGSGLKTLELLDEIGVDKTRIICTTESTRWERNAAGQSFTVPEYYDACLEAAKGYISGEHKMTLDFWQFLELDPRSRHYHLAPMRGCSIGYRETLPVCKGTRGMIAVAADGEVYPCMQMSGWMKAHEVTFGNVKRDGLQSVLQSSVYLDTVCSSVGDNIRENKKCAQCKYLKDCLCGCPAISVLTSGGNFHAPDPWKCFFFDHGYMEKCERELTPYRNLTRMTEH